MCEASWVFVSTADVCVFVRWLSSFGALISDRRREVLPNLVLTDAEEKLSPQPTFYLLCCCRCLFASFLSALSHFNFENLQSRLSGLRKCLFSVRLCETWIGFAFCQYRGLCLSTNRVPPRDHRCVWVLKRPKQTKRCLKSMEETTKRVKSRFDAWRSVESSCLCPPPQEPFSRLFLHLCFFVPCLFNKFNVQNYTKV